MGCETSKQKKLAKLKIISNNTLDERQIENIVINTYFNEGDLCILFKRFSDLKPNLDGKISNGQLLEMNEFKFCPFKKFLPNALKLVTEEDFQNIKNKSSMAVGKRNTIHEQEDGNDTHNKINNSNKMHRDSKYKNDNYLNSIDKSDGENSKEKLFINNNLQSNNSETNRLNSKTQNDLGKIKNNLNSDVNIEMNNEVNIKENNDPLNQYQYIDFSKFCEIMRVFNDKYPVDLKIRFYFKLFDVDSDGRISKEDLLIFLLEVFPEDLIAENADKEEKKNQKEKEKLEKEQKEEKEEDEKEEDEDNNKENVLEKEITENIDDHTYIHFEKLIEIVFGEIISNDNRKYIDYDDFNTIMWTTNIDKSCSIDFTNQ